jgi:hypothetical protein
MLFIEVDASDVGWGACAYQMVLVWTGDPNDQARARINDTGKRKIIEWISKSWNEHELKLPVLCSTVKLWQGSCVWKDFEIL